jgi:heparosan-N-sulfate-glucuronate 5-epimerase
LLCRCAAVGAAILLLAGCGSSSSSSVAQLPKLPKSGYKVLRKLRERVYPDTGTYLDSATWSDDSLPTDRAGIPLVRYPSGLEYNPVTITEWGLEHWSRWTTSHTRANYQKAIQAARWLVAHQHPDGSWQYGFDFKLYSLELKPPWISALAQGQAMSLLWRVYAATGWHRYIAAALAALGPLEKPLRAGGVASVWKGVLWFEEYPTDPPLHVLNGFEFTLIGLHDLSDVSPEARRLFRTGLSSLLARIGEFDDRAAHTESYGAPESPAGQPAGPPYPRVVAMLTRTLASISGAKALKFYAARWTRYLTPSSKHRA